jgi:hypothetical protein
VAVTLPAPPVPELAQQQPPRRGLSTPVALVALVVLSTVIIVACVLGATFSGLVGLFKASSDASPAPAASAFVAPVPRQADRFSDGLWLVPSFVRTGTYTTTVPANSAGCAWARIGSGDGTANSVVESGTGRNGDTIAVTIEDTDTAFQTEGCGQWRRIGD